MLRQLARFEANGDARQTPMESGLRSPKLGIKKFSLPPKMSNNSASASSLLPSLYAHEQAITMDLLPPETSPKSKR